MLRTFAALFMRDPGLWLSFQVVSLSGFGIRCVLLLGVELRSTPSATVFWRELHRISIISFLNVCSNWSVNSSGPGALFWKVMNYWFNFFNTGLLHFIALGRYHAFYKLKVCGSCVSSKSIPAVFSVAHLVFWCHILVIHAVFQFFSLWLYLSWWSVISDLWCCYYKKIAACWRLRWRLA